MSEGPSALPGVIVVAEPCIHELLATAPAEWLVQERQSSVPAMWENLSGGRLSAQSRILVFTDSPLQDVAPDRLADAGMSGPISEREQTARAIVAMASAGAHVFIAVWQSADVDVLRRAIDDASAARGLAPESSLYHLLPIEKGGREVLTFMRGVLDDEVRFGTQFAATVDEPLRRSQALPKSEVPLPVATALDPVLPPLGIGRRVGGSDGTYSGASEELLARPPRPGQVTITVTSSKGGSGKSTASLLLAASIARASRAAGRPLSV